MCVVDGRRFVHQRTVVLLIVAGLVTTCYTSIRNRGIEFVQDVPHQSGVALKRTQQVCMLVPVHEPHFGFLQKRLNLTYSLVEGEQPNTVVVFDDDSAILEYMAQNPAHRDNANIHALSLKKMVGEDDFSKLAEFLQITNETDAFHPGNHSGCLKRTPGRVYQAIKKFYGPLYSPDFCKYFWVSDAESWPFRKYNFNELIQYSFVNSTTSMYQIVNSWHPRQDCLGVKHNSHTDPSCGIMVQDGLGYSGYWDERDGSADSLERKLQQTMFDLNNWWMYERETIKHMHELVELRLDKSVATTLVTYRLADIAFWTQYLQSLDSRSDSLSIRNFPDEVKLAFPLAFDRCCSCADNLIPCADLHVLFSPCFLEHATHQQIGNFIVEQLGIFGILGNDISAIPIELFNAEKRISWVTNNADLWHQDHAVLVGVQ